MLYGRSLSGCLFDVLTQRIDPTWIGAIVTGTSATSEDKFIELLRYYATHSLQEWSYQQIYTVGMGLWRTGKIIQPRGLDPNAVQNPSVRGRWTDSIVAAFATIVDQRDPNHNPLEYTCQGCERLHNHNVCTDPYCAYYDNASNIVVRGIAPEPYIQEIRDKLVVADTFMRS